MWRLWPLESSHDLRSTLTPCFYFSKRPMETISLVSPLQGIAPSLGINDIRIDYINIDNLPPLLSFPLSQRRRDVSLISLSIYHSRNGLANTYLKLEIKVNAESCEFLGAYIRRVGLVCIWITCKCHSCKSRWFSDWLDLPLCERGFSCTY